ncbi:MAG TPA: pirin-like C-terminal cupin domain-containing protein [Gammaproteobacteria bacterium]|nr:pirin-like C-terminal cupin domain-containing protein [Gammaproteobacteria bacterium]
MMGSAFGEASPVRTFAETLYLEATLEDGQSLALPEAGERAAYVVSGHVETGDSAIPEHSLAVFAPGSRITLTATRPSRIAVIGGEALGHRYIEWNFASSRKQRIEQAKALWQSGGFAKVRGDEKEFIPLPE